MGKDYKEFLYIQAINNNNNKQEKKLSHNTMTGNKTDYDLILV